MVLFNFKSTIIIALSVFASVAEAARDIVRKELEILSGPEFDPYERVLRQSPNVETPLELKLPGSIQIMSTSKDDQLWLLVKEEGKQNKKPQIYEFPVLPGQDMLVRADNMEVLSLLLPRNHLALRANEVSFEDSDLLTLYVKCKGLCLKGLTLWGSDEQPSIIDAHVIYGDLYVGPGVRVPSLLTNQPNFVLDPRITRGGKGRNYAEVKAEKMILHVHKDPGLVDLDLHEREITTTPDDDPDDDEYGLDGIWAT